MPQSCLTSPGSATRYNATAEATWQDLVCNHEAVPVGPQCVLPPQAAAFYFDDGSVEGAEEQFE
eukprot:CAMPEP_0202909040 /NCGR_PEP_ID=MMETSP1392-20130828/48078_1 /ASSEMBLY_ACC=CAM_ASM_000868 /TAXON_ID=225041 /ORGANISM="Chlamydomonas chlamydogama, Strain SAG 11-48b" /LENGTH=63 /DNA_ID=CAMNT_0049598641 /DNA_START=67 /DNA_END=256 /DNA_ORIENTATION=-